MTDGPFTHLVTSEEELRAGGYPEPPPRAWAKELEALDEHCAAFLARSPLVMLATSSPGGRPTVSPRGGPAGFVRMLDPSRIAWADLTGNRRLDAFRHILANPEVGLLACIPGLRETLRIDGTAYLTRDPAILRAVDVPGRTAELAVGLRVRVAFLQCGKAMIRSRVWEPESWPAAEDLPSPARMLRAARADGTSLEEVEAILDESYTTRLW
ncbi:MAG: pyridoxamine 5'-phosphate oxidase family protein [Solirubrobacterales bacterium]|nr:pyridoxamine 5'-phosphate oxidase family protein [Solirubrobacterales bacterium]